MQNLLGLYSPQDIVGGQGIGASASPALRAREANNWLDRAGHAPIKREEHLHGHLTRDDIEKIKDRALRANGPVVEAEYKRVS